MGDSELNNQQSPFVLSKQRRIINFLPNEIDIKEILRSYRIQNKTPYEISEQQTPSKNINNSDKLMRMKRVILNQFDRPNIKIHKQQKLRENFQEQYPYFLHIKQIKTSTQPNSPQFLKQIPRNRIQSLGKQLSKKKLLDFNYNKTKKINIQQYDITAWTRKTSESF